MTSTPRSTHLLSIGMPEGLSSERQEALRTLLYTKLHGVAYGYRLTPHEDIISVTWHSTGPGTTYVTTSRLADQYVKQLSNSLMSAVQASLGRDVPRLQYVTSKLLYP